ncbi:unnamed protein product, partial [Cylicostephanus goldi]
QHSTIVPNNVLEVKKPDNLRSTKERQEQRSPVFAALIISLALANTVFLVLLAICLILYINLKPKDGESTNAKAGRRKRSSIKRRKGKRGEEHLTKTTYNEDVDLNRSNKKTGIQLTVIKPTELSAPPIQPNANDRDLQTAIQSLPDTNNINRSPGAGSNAPRSTALDVLPKQSLQMPVKSSFAGVRHSPAKSVFSHLPWFQPRRERSVFAAGNLQSEHAF